MPKPSRQLAAEAAAADRSASELVRELVGDFIERQRQAREHDAWFRAEVEQGLREADDSSTMRRWRKAGGGCASSGRKRLTAKLVESSMASPANLW
jgi:HPt (histidine-containing phosphotransfer) domain-containing protein